MEDPLFRKFFTRPTNPYQRRYEALRAVCIDGQSQKQAAERFGFRYSTMRQLMYEFRKQQMEAESQSPFREMTVGRPAVEVIADQAIEEQTPLVADRRELILSTIDPLCLRTRVMGLFLFLPMLAEIGFDKLVQRAGYSGSRQIPADAALLRLLALKLLDKERRCHINDFNFDEALGLFAGLNILPKKSFATDDSYRTDRECQQKLLAGWVKKITPLLLPEATSFSLDFHPIPYRGEEAVLENHYIPCRGQATPSVQSFFALEHKNHVFCYANANLMHSEQAAEVLRFVEFWHQLTGSDPEWLYFDSKLTTYIELSRLNERGVYFATIRRRGSSVVKQLMSRPISDWTPAVIDIPKRRHKQIRYLEESVRLSDYDGVVRQIAVTGLGHEQPTLFLTNNFDVRPRELIMNYARRNGIEDALGTNVNFFHLDCLSSEVRLNVDLDVTLTVIANGCYRWLAQKLKGFEKAKPKQLYRKFVETGGEVEVLPGRQLQVTFDRRYHNPTLREAALDHEHQRIAWLHNFHLAFNYL